MFPQWNFVIDFFVNSIITFLKNVLTFCIKYLSYQLSLRNVCCYPRDKKTNHQNQECLWKKAQQGTKVPPLGFNSSEKPRRWMLMSAIAVRPPVPRVRALLVEAGRPCLLSSRAPAVLHQKQALWKKRIWAVLFAVSPRVV